MDSDRERVSLMMKAFEIAWIEAPAEDFSTAAFLAAAE
jgi:hypothetical protein